MQSLWGGGAKATANLQPTKGSTVRGTVNFEQRGDKVRVAANISGLRPNGEFGFHVHEAGDCSSGDGMSAKGHFNPFGKPHGAHGSAERHAGDLPSLKSDASGNASLTADVDTITRRLRPGEHRRPRPDRPRAARRLQDPAHRQCRRAQRLRGDTATELKTTGGGGAGRASQDALSFSRLLRR